eukprot:504881_1
MSTKVTQQLMLMVSGFVRTHFKSKQIVPQTIILLLMDFSNIHTIEWNTIQRISSKYNFKSTAPDCDSFNILYGIPLKLAIAPAWNDYNQSALLLRLNSANITKRNMISFILSVSINTSTEFIKELKLGVKGSNFEHIEQYWIVIENIKKNHSHLLSFHDQIAYINIKFSIILVDIKYFEMNIINKLDWSGMNTKTKYKHDLFNMSWQRVEGDGYSKIFIAFVFDTLPYKIHQVGIQFDFISDDEILFTDTKECSESDVRFLCDSKYFDRTQMLKLSVVFLYSSFHDEISKDKWVEYGFIQ